MNEFENKIYKKGYSDGFKDGVIAAKEIFKDMLEIKECGDGVPPILIDEIMKEPK